MLFAINYSPQAAELVRAGRIVVDRFKCPDWPHLIAEARALLPVYVHFDLRAGGAPNGPIDWEPVEALRTSTVTPYVNLHLGPRPADFPSFPVETNDPAHVAAIAARLIEHVGAAVDRFGADRVIVENLLSAPAFQLMRPTILPGVIRQVVDETGCGFLLDISHARLAAAHLGMDAIDYLGQMPGERLREIHITGIRTDSSGEQCDHMGMTDQDWPFVEWVLDRVRGGDWAEPWIASFEYGGIGPHFEWRSESSVIAEQVPRLYDLVHRLG